MVETKRMKMLTNIYNKEIKYKLFEEYESFDGLKKLRTFIVLNDNFDTTLKMDEIGLSSEESINELERLGYISINNVKAKLRLRK